MTKVKCIECGHIIDVEEKVDEMIKLKLNNPNLEFHPSFYNHCSNCGCKEVEVLDNAEQEQNLPKVSYLKCSNNLVEIMNIEEDLLNSNYKEIDYKALQRAEEQRRKQEISRVKAKIHNALSFWEQHKKGGEYQLYCPKCGTYSYYHYDNKLQAGVTNPFISDMKCKNCGNKQCIIAERVGDRYVR